MKLNRPMVFLTAGWFLVASMAMAADAPDAKGVPVAVFDSMTYNFNPVVEGMTVVHDFVIKNSGTADLKIEKVKTG